MNQIQNFIKGIKSSHGKESGATLVFNLKICNLVALISRILSLTVQGVIQCNLLTYVCSAGEIRKKKVILWEARI